jgi:hypothetical protein
LPTMPMPGCACGRSPGGSRLPSSPGARANTKSPDRRPWRSRGPGAS